MESPCGPLFGRSVDLWGPGGPDFEAWVPGNDLFFLKKKVWAPFLGSKNMKG